MTVRTETNIRITVGGSDELQVYHSQAAKLAHAVVYVHGFGASRMSEKPRALEQACARRNWPFVSFDFRGHGLSTSTMLELRGSRLLEDLEGLARYLAGRDISRLYLVGSSMGGWASGWFALRHPELIPACAMIAPALDFVRGRWNKLSELERKQWQDTGRLRVKNVWIDTEIGYGLVEESDNFPYERLINDWQKPLLIFHGMKDDAVSHTQSMAFIDKVSAQAVELRLYKNGDHRLVERKDEMAEAACEFFARHGAE